MRQNSKLKIIDKSSNSVSLLVIGVAAVTLFLRTDFYDPFNSAKFILLVLIASWLIGYLINTYKEFPIKRKSHEFTTTLILVIFLLFLFISTLFTDVLIVGLLGDTQRRNGFLTYLALGVVLLYAARAIDYSNVMLVYKLGILTGLVLSSYGLMQISGRDFIAWNNPYNSMISTLGNPNFASATLAILSSLALFGMFLKKLPIIYKIIGVIFIVVALVDIVASDSRQGLLTIFFSLISYFSIYSYLKNRKIGIVVISISLLGAYLAIIGMLQKGPLASLLYKESISVRGYYWRAGIEMFKNSPLTGIGVDRYGAYFKQFREVSYPLKYGFEITSSNAHNTFIQLFATAGIFAGTVYLLMLFYILFTGLKLIKNSTLEDQKVVLGLISAWIGFQAQSLISIDNIGIAVWGWLLGGSILGLGRKQESSSIENFTTQRFQNRKKSVKVNGFQLTISVIVLIPVLVFSTLIYKFETNLNFMKSYSVPENKQIILKYANNIIENPVSDPFYKYIAAFYLDSIGEKEEAYKINEVLFRSDKQNPEYLKGMAYFALNRNDIPGVISIREQIVKIDPWNAENYLQLLILYKNSGDLLNAKAMKDKILSFAPNTEIAKKALEVLG
jgi:O-antigen ligase